MRSLLFVLLSFVVSLSAKADPVDKQQARQEAEKFLQTKGVAVSGEAVRPARRKSPSSKHPFYVFNAADNRGFVIVAGDDRIDPILGYTSQGSFDDGELPDNFRIWLEKTAEEIESFIDRPAKARAESGTRATVQKVAIHRAISPLIITMWDQGNNDNVYNSLLPLVSGQLPCTGCVATAGAQVMYYFHKDLPSTTLPVPGYKLDKSHGADTSKDLPAIQFKWDKMKTSYSYKEPGTPNTAEEDAVAELMLYCGYAAQMNYGLSQTGGSGAVTAVLADGMSKYFGFNPNTWQDVFRSNYSIREWDELIYNELASGRPVIYSGSFYGGHAFLCDGYDGAGLYHFNWGWGGSSNGYFKLHATNPYGEYDIGFIDGIEAIIGLQPSSWPDIEAPNADDMWEVQEIEGIVATASDVKVENTTITMRMSNNNVGTYGFGFGIGKLNEDGTVSPIDTQNEHYNDYSLQQGWSFSNISFDVSSYDLPNGKHTLVPISIVNGESAWKRCRPADVFFDLDVASGVKTIIAHPIEKLQVNKFELATGGTPNSAQSFVLNITNNGDNLEKYLYVFLGDEKNIGEQVAGKTIKIAKGNTKEYHIPTYWWRTLEAGTYVVRLASDYNGTDVLAQTVITITQDLKATKFNIVGPVFSNASTKVIATIENYAGDYALPLYLFGSANGTKEFYYAAGSAIEKGSSEDVTFYFTPNTTGIWTLEVATDKDGANVIGSTTVEVTSAPSGNVALQLVGSKIQSFGNKAIYTMSIKNTGSVTNYREISTWLYENGSDYSIASQKTSKVTIEPGETKDISVTYSGLENGKKYWILLNYYENFYMNSNKWLASYDFTFVASEETSLPGDANADGKVDVMDVKDMANYILGKATSTGKFDVNAADMNNDKVVNAADIVVLVNKILGS